MLEGQEALSLGIATHWTEAQLVGWLDRKLRQPDIPYTSLVEFIRRHVRYLQEFKKVNLPDLVRLRFVLEKLLKQKISNCREKSYDARPQIVYLIPLKGPQGSPGNPVDCQGSNILFSIGTYWFLRKSK